MLPFTSEQFFGVFETYNTAVWPAQIFLMAAALAALYSALRPTRFGGRLVLVVLGVLWLWVGLVYHLGFFARINPAARLFGALFVLQGLLWLGTGVVRPRLSFHAVAGVERWTGWLLAVYALALYPLLGMLFGHVYPAAPTLATPCPTTILTFAFLLWADERVPIHLLVIPFLWSIVGSSAALAFGVVEDVVLLAAGLVGTGLILRRNRAVRRAPMTALAGQPAAGRREASKA